MSIYDISLGHFSALPKSDINSTTPSRQIYIVVHSFLSDDRKQYAAHITAHSKCLIEMIKDKKSLTESLSTIW